MPKKPTSPSARPSPAALVAQCAALPLDARISFAKTWGATNPRKATATLPPPDRAAATLLTLSLFAWMRLKAVWDTLAGAGPGAAATLIPSFKEAAERVVAAAREAGITLPTTWFCPPELLHGPASGPEAASP